MDSVHVVVHAIDRKTWIDC